MPTYHNNIFCVTPKELEKCGMKLKTIYSYISKQERGELYCWENHKHGKNTYIHFESLKPQYKELVKAKLCKGIEPEVFVKNESENEKQQVIENLTDQITNLVKSDPEEIKLLTAAKQYTPTEVHQLARAAGWLRLINEFDVKKARKLGFSSINDFRNELFKRCLNEQTSNPPLVKFKKGLITNIRTLVKNAVEYRDNGISALMHAGIGNVNREKVDTLIHAKLVELASNPVKYSFEDISLMYNTWAVAHDKERLTTSAVKQRLNQPKAKKVWYYARHGKLAADNEIQPLINREKPSFPDALWSLDGTTMQLYYRDSNNKVKSDLYVYLVTDGHTGAVIGKSVAFTETSEMVDAALRDAILTHENKPYQLQYDNSSANISVAVQNLMNNMSRVHFPCEPLKGRSKYVEGIIGHLQQRVLRYYENFKGGNVTVKSLNSKANPELLKKLSKNPELLPDINQVMEMFDSGIRSYNNRSSKRDQYGSFIGSSKIELYKTIEHPERQKVTYFDRISMFMVEQRTPYNYGVNGIEIEVKGNKHNFIVPDPDKVGDFIFSAENFGKKFKVRIDRQNPDMIALYNDKGVFIEFAYLKEKYAACVADMKQNPDSTARRIMFKQKQDEYGWEYSIKELERQMNILGDLRATGTDGLGWWDSSKTITNDRESTAEDTLNGMNDGLTDRQRKILRIGK